eukprot:1415993-Rhodomonas_salina.3
MEATPAYMVADLRRMEAGSSSRSDLARRSLTSDIASRLAAAKLTSGPGIASRMRRTAFGGSTGTGLRWSTAQQSRRVCCVSTNRGIANALDTLCQYRAWHSNA